MGPDPCEKQASKTRGRGRGLSLEEGSPRFMLKVKSSFSRGFPALKHHFNALPACGKLLIKNIFHSEMRSLLYVGVMGIISENQCFGYNPLKIAFCKVLEHSGVIL